MSDLQNVLFNPYSERERETEVVAGYVGLVCRQATRLAAGWRWWWLGEREHRAVGDPTNIWLLNPNEHGEGGSTSLSLEGEGVGKGGQSL